MISNTYKLSSQRSMFLLLMLLFTGSVWANNKPIKIAISSGPTRLSPFFATDANSQNINRLVHTTLTDFNQQMKFECVLCQQFEERIERAKHIIKFTLKDDVFFHDGQKVTAQDVYNSWKLFTDETKIKSIFRFAFSKIEDVRILSPSVVELVYEEFSLENLSNLALFKILKIKNVPSGKIPDHNPEIDEIIGAGPYAIDKIKPLEIVLKPVKGDLSWLQFKVVKDETTLALKLINKEIDVSVSNLTPRKVEWLRKNNKNLNFIEKDGTNYQYISINHKKDKLKDKKVIKAISHLIPREKIVKYKLKGMGVLANSLFSKAFTNYYTDLPIDHYDPKLSEQLLKEAGYAKNDQNFWSKNNKPLSLDWKASNNKATMEMAQTIKGFLEKEGIQVSLTFQEWGTFMRNFKVGNFDIVVGQWVGFTGADMLRYAFHSESIPPKGGNRGFFSNQQFDKVVDLATNEVNESKRNEYYRQALEIAFKNYAYINLWHPKVIWIARNCIKDVEIYPNGNFMGLLNVENHCE